MSNTAARSLIQPRAGGIWCEPGGFYVDPGRVVERAVVTHAHADHCRPGHKSMLATPETAAIARARHGAKAFGRVETLAYGTPQKIGDVTVTLFPAGHVLGSAQVLIEMGGARAVVSGDYKRRADPSCAPFELAECDLFVTEATFGLPVYRHPPVKDEIDRLLASMKRRPQRAHLIGAYSLGKAQRLIAELRVAGYDRTIWVHSALLKICRVYEAFGMPMGPLADASDLTGRALAGEIVIAPPGTVGNRWAEQLGDPVVVGASGWMRVRKLALGRGVELALVISDHADWDELTQTITDTGAGEVWVTHGKEDALIHWCGTKGIHAEALRLVGRGEEELV